MKEISAILKAWDRSGILATVVGVRGSAYRKPGARMLVMANGVRIGSISGGCLESEVAKKAAWLTSNGRVVRTYNGDEFGLGCNGSVDVLLERLDAPHAQRHMQFLANRYAEGEPGLIATLTEGPDLGRRLYVAGGKVWSSDLENPGLLAKQAFEAARDGESRMCPNAFIEYFAVPLRLLVFGAGFDVAPLVSMAKLLGWHVTVAAARPVQSPLADEVVLLPADDFTCGVDIRPETAIVLMTHNYATDRELLQRLLPLRPRYLGLLGPRARTRQLLEEIGGHIDSRQLHAPIGLDLGADTPEGIALSIVAEIQAVAAGRSAKMLRSRDEPIYAPVPEFA